MIKTLAYGSSSESADSKSYPMNTNMTGFRSFLKIFASLCFGEKKSQHWKGTTGLSNLLWDSKIANL